MVIYVRVPHVRCSYVGLIQAQNPRAAFTSLRRFGFVVASSSEPDSHDGQWTPRGGVGARPLCATQAPGTKLLDIVGGARAQCLADEAVGASRRAAATLGSRLSCPNRPCVGNRCLPSLCLQQKSPRNEGAGGPQVFGVSMGSNSGLLGQAKPTLRRLFLLLAASEAASCQPCCRGL